MQQRVLSRLALRRLLKFRTCAEGWIAREWTCWKPRRKTAGQCLNGCLSERAHPTKQLHWRVEVACDERETGGY
jgi:hypothetical protein